MQKFKCAAMAALLFILFRVPVAYSQVSLSGKITDSVSRKPIAAASITLKGPETAQSYSEADGTFEFKNLSKGNYSITVSYLGYRTLRKQIQADKTLTGLQLPLKETGLFIEPIEVQSTRAGEKAPFTKTNISGAELSKENLGQDLPFLLKQQPAVMTTSDAGAGTGYTNIWIRGSDVSRINVTFNGIPVNDAESAGTFFVDIPDITSSVNDIQIQRGVGASTNGAGAFGATINLSTNTFHPEPYGSMMNSFGSFNTWKHSVKAGSGLLHDHFTLDARLSSITSEGYIDRASSNLKSYYLSGAYFNQKTSIRFNMFSGKEKTYQAWNGVPEDSLKTNRRFNGLGLMPDGAYYDNQTDNYTQTYYQLFWNQELNGNWNFNVAAFLTRGKGYYEEYEMDQAYSDYGLPNPVFGKDTLKKTHLIRRQWLDNYFYGTVFSLNYKKEGFGATLGGGWNRYDAGHYGTVIWAEQAIDKAYRYYANPANKRDFNLYWKGNQTLSDQWTAFLDLQYRKVEYNLYGFKHHPDIRQHNRYHFFNPKAGINFQFNSRDRFYLSFARAHKEPNRDDYEANMKDLPKPEALTDFELGYDRSGSVYHLHANGYYMQYQNQLVLTGKINDVGAYTRTNVPRSFRAGIELNGSVKFGPIWSFSANAALSENKIRDFTGYLDDDDRGGQKQMTYKKTAISFSPSVISGATLTINPVKNLTGGLSGKYVSRRYLDNTEDKKRSLAPYLVNDLQIHYNWQPKWIERIQFNLIINNLFNVKYLTNGYAYAYWEDGKIQTDNWYFPQAGIHFLFGIQIDL